MITAAVAGRLYYYFWVLNFDSSFHRQFYVFSNFFPKEYVGCVLSLPTTEIAFLLPLHVPLHFFRRGIQCGRERVWDHPDLCSCFLPSVYSQCLFLLLWFKKIYCFPWDLVNPFGLFSLRNLGFVYLRFLLLLYFVFVFCSFIRDFSYFGGSFLVSWIFFAKKNHIKRIYTQAQI